MYFERVRHCFLANYIMPRGKKDLCGLQSAFTFYIEKSKVYVTYFQETARGNFTESQSKGYYVARVLLKS